MSFPTTRTTLLKQLSAHDSSAWTEFFHAYRPAIRDVGVFKGLTPDECDELVQNTMIRFSRRVDEGFQYDASLARFRTYFNRIVKGCIYDLLRKRRPSAEASPEDYPDENSPDELLDRLLLEKWRNFLLQQAQVELKNRVEAKTYQIFELLAVQREPVDRIAKLLQVKPAYVYLARQRCEEHLRKIIADLNRQDGELDLHG